MRSFFHSSIWLNLTIFVGVLVITTSSILIWTGYVFTRDILVDQIHERLTVVAADRQALLLAYIRQQQERVNLVASRTRLRQLLEAHADGQIDEITFRTESRRILGDAHQSTEDFLAILITDADGQVVTATADAYLGQDRSAELAFIEGQHRAFVDLPRWRGSGYQTFLSGPAIANNGRALGVVMVDLRLDRFEQLLRDVTALGETGEVLVGTRRADQVRYLLPPRHAPQTTTMALTSVPAMAAALQGQVGFIQTIDYRETDVLAVYQPVGYQDWGMVAKIDVAEAYTPIERLRFTLLSIGGVILLLGLAAASVLARRFTQPIVKLAQTAAIVGKGDLSARVGLPPGSGEINQLAQAFDDMARGLETSYRALQQEGSERKKTAEQLRVLNETLEQRIVERTQELARSNAELEQFAYAASHDLQEPLRKVQAFGDLLEETSYEALNQEGRDYLTRIRDAARRMQTLINDLLEISRVTTRSHPFTPVDLTQVVREVLSDLQIRLEQSGGRVELNKLPSIEADPIQMHQLLQNLISNGLKYQPNDAKPVITIYSQIVPCPESDRGDGNEQEFCQIMVEDNGIGFDEKHVERIFLLFQRLHRRTEYQGTGIGLALCRKIVRRHGGSITAKSKPGQGSTFIVTLPTKQAKVETI